MQEIKLSILEDKYETPQDVISKGQDSKLLQNSHIFRHAVNDMYNRLTMNEDMLLGSSDLDERQINQKIKHYAMMRCLLSDFITTLDSFVQQAENAEFQQKLSDNQGA